MAFFRSVDLSKCLMENRLIFFSPFLPSLSETCISWTANACQKKKRKSNSITGIRLGNYIIWLHCGSMAYKRTCSKRITFKGKFIVTTGILLIEKIEAHIFISFILNFFQFLFFRWFNYVATVWFFFKKFYCKRLWVIT